METPLLHAFDIEHLEPVTIETTLTLPRIREDEVQSSTRDFSDVLAEHGACDVWREPQLMVEFLTRCLLSASYELVHSPANVLACFRNPHVEPWFERRCELIVPSDAGTEENIRQIATQLDAWSLHPKQRSVLRDATLAIAVGSLVSLGRLPIQYFEPSEAH